VLIIIIIIIIVVVVGSPFGVITFLRRFRQSSSGFHVFGFRNNNFLQSKVVSLASNPEPGGPGSCIYVPQ
jgi:uncharacterized membrane protein